jgi:hypothetical protein
MEPVRVDHNRANLQDERASRRKQTEISHRGHGQSRPSLHVLTQDVTHRPGQIRIVQLGHGPMITEPPTLRMFIEACSGQGLRGAGPMSESRPD